MMSRFAVIERASIDEAYMDLTAAVQQRLKDMTDKQIEPRLLRTTYIQGYPHTSPELEASAEPAVSDKGGVYPKLNDYSSNCFKTRQGMQVLRSDTIHNHKHSGRMYALMSTTFVPRGAEVQRSPAVAGLLNCLSLRGAEFCGCAANPGGTHCGGNEVSRGETHRFPLLSRDIPQQGNKTSRCFIPLNIMRVKYFKEK